MSKIFNWFFGSFFRTLGRILTYLLIGYGISILLSNANINIIDYLIPNTYALVVESDMKPFNSDNYFTNCTSGDNCWNYAGGISKDFQGVIYNTTDITTNGLNGFGAGLMIETDTTLVKGNYYTATLVGSASGNVDISNKFTNSQVKLLCGSGNGAYYMPLVQATNVSTTIDSYLNNSGTTISGLSVLKYTFRATDTGNYMFLRFTTTSPFTGKFYFYAYDIDFVGTGTDNSDVVNAIEGIGQQNQTIIDQNSQTNSKLDSVNDNINKVEDTITNDSVDDNKINEFIDASNKEDSSLTPFSDFINLPLKWVQSLLASGQSCEPITLPLPFTKRTITLMCMTEFWEKMGVLGVLIQTVWIAVVGVRIFNGLFLLTCETLDPNPDKDMTKLRTWEL